MTEESSYEVHFLDYLRIVYKRRWIALASFLAIVLSVTVYTFTATSIFEGRAQLLIEPDNPNVVSFQEVIEQDRSTTDFYQTQYRVLQSRALARKTIESLGLWSHVEFQREDLSSMVDTAFSHAGRWVSGLSGNEARPEPAAAGGETLAQSKIIDGFLVHLQIVPVRNSRLVELVFESADPELAARVANTQARAYIEHTLEVKFMASKEASDWLGERLAEQRAKVEATEVALQQYREQGDAVALEDRQNIVVQRLADLNTAVTKARTDRIEREAKYRQLQGIVNDREALDTFPAILANPFVQALKSQLADMQRQQAQNSDRLGEKHPEMIKLRSSIESAEAKLQGEILKVVESVRNEYQAAQAQEASLTAALDSQKREALALNRKGIEYGALRRDAESNRQIYEALMQRAKETGISGELKASNVRIVDPAEVTDKPVRPRRLTNLLLALAGGFLLGVGLAFASEYLDNRIKSPDELKQHLSVSCLGMVPALSEEIEGRGGEPLLSGAVSPNFVEALRTIRTNLLFSSAEDGSRSLVITSTGPAEGKTVLASNLAIALAHAGRRVLLIDADMRRPRVHEVFDTKQEPGLSNLLVGTAKASELLIKTTVAGLWLVPAGRVPPNAAELLGSMRFREFLASLEEHFDWILIDTPPVLAVTDASVIAHWTSGVVFVVGSEMTSRLSARTAVEQLESTGAHILGAVLNRVNLDRDGYYYAQYYRREYSQYYTSAAS